MKLSIFTTTYKSRDRQELYDQALACYRELADEVVEIDDRWPEEFSWPLIGEMFQRGYDRCTGDYVIHADLDYIFHEEDHQKIRDLMGTADTFNFWKYMFYNPKKFTLKSRLTIMVNKAKYGDRIRFNGGGDLCQPTLDGVLLDWKNTTEARVPFYCYDALLKEKELQAKDRARFARAYHRHFGNWGHGHEETALEDWLDMVRGRYAKHQPFTGTHPKYMTNTIANLKPEQFGYNGWGMWDA